MALPFRQRIFVVLVALTAVPTALAVVGWALAVRTVGPSAGARVALEEMAASARQMVDRIGTTRLAPRERAAVREHLERLSGSVTLARRAETYLRYYAGGFALVVIVFGGLALTAAVRLAGHLSRQLSRPIDELVGWTRLIRRRMPLPAGPPTRGAPEFEALRQALRELATALDAARERELEAERLRAFREVARRVAHEIKNPLTSMRIAVDQLRRSGGQADGRMGVVVDVMQSETERLERLAREFSDFGRLPAGPKSEVDLVDLLVQLGKSAAPPFPSCSRPHEPAYPAGRRRDQHPQDGRGAARVRGIRDGGGRERQRRARRGRARRAGRRPAGPHDARRAGRPRHAGAAEAPRARRAGRDDEREGEPHRRGAGDQAGRISVPGEAAHARGGGHHVARRPRAVAHPGREPPAARSAGARGSPGGRERRDAGAA